MPLTWLIDSLVELLGGSKIACPDDEKDFIPALVEQLGLTSQFLRTILEQVD